MNSDYHTTIIDRATITGQPVLYSAVSVTTSGLSLTDGDSFSAQWVADGTQSAQATATATVSGGNVTACTLAFTDSAAIALFAGGRRDPQPGRFLLWDLTTRVVYAMGELPLTWAPNPAG